MIEFRTSTFCSHGDCVEVGMEPSGGVVAVRDTKDRERQLEFGLEDWVTFTTYVKAGRYDFA